MIFAYYNYKEYHNGNKETWPIQPPTQEAWNTMVNNDYAYCQKNQSLMGARHIAKYHFPSYHPYWGRQAKKNSLVYVCTLIEKLKKCIKNDTLYKTEFRKGASYHSVILFDILPIIEREGLKIKMPKDSVGNKSFEHNVNLHVLLGKVKLSWA